MDTPVPPSHGLHRNVKILGGASLLNDIASEMVYPLLPEFFLTTLGGTKSFLGLVEGVADSMASLLKLWSGGRSDQAGRRKGFVLFGYLLAGLTRPLIGLITLPWQLLGLRAADRLGKGVRTSPRDALIADSSEPSQRGRAFGFHRGMDHLGAAIGPLLAIAFLWFWPGELRTLFLLTLVPALLVLLLLVFGLRETPAQQAPKEPLKLTLKPFDRPFRLYLVALVVFTLGNASDLFLLVRAGELGVPTLWLPLLWCAFHLLKSSSNLLFGAAVDRRGPRPFIILGWLVYAAIYLAFGLASTAWEAWLYFLLYALFYGLTEPAEKTLVTHLAGPERKGLAFGWFNFATGIAALPSSLIFGILYEEFGALTAFSWGAGLAFLAVILLLAVGKGGPKASGP